VLERLFLPWVRDERSWRWDSNALQKAAQIRGLAVVGRFTCLPMASAVPGSLSSRGPSLPGLLESGNRISNEGLKV
jgi:hypothetical protein